MKALNFFILFLILTASACHREHPRPVPPSIFGFWRYESGVVADHPDSANPLVLPLAYIILREDGTMSGFTSRNILGGTFRYDETGFLKLDFQMLTRVADTPWSGGFMGMLESADAYRLEGNRLVLTNTETGEELQFLKLSAETCKPVPNNQDLYQQAQTDPFDILDVKVVNQCLELSIGYGGGCGQVGGLLIGSGNYAESIPPQLAVKFVFTDRDDCEAYVVKRFYFDLTDLEYEGAESLQLNLSGWTEPILVPFD